jgi:hypothetical protein
LKDVFFANSDSVVLMWFEAYLCFCACTPAFFACVVAGYCRYLAGFKSGSCIFEEVLVCYCCAVLVYRYFVTLRIGADYFTDPVSAYACLVALSELQVCEDFLYSLESLVSANLRNAVFVKAGCRVSFDSG